MEKKYFIIDFDSTFVRSEGLEELAEAALKNDPGKAKTLSEIRRITSWGMEGKINFRESLCKRLRLLKVNRVHIETVVRELKKKVSRSVIRNKKFFRSYKSRIYIVSGGFIDYVLPIVKAFGIANTHVFANSLIFDKAGNVSGFDVKNPLSSDSGKVKVVKSLGLRGDIYAIGDGYTDYQLKELGVVKKFVAFTENIEREVVMNKADQIASNFDEFLYINKLPTSVSYPKSRIKVLLLENIDSAATLAFEREGYEVRSYEGVLSQKDLLKKIRDVRILGVRSRTMIPAGILRSVQKMLTIGAFCIGTDQIDLREATARGIAVFNAPYSNTRSVVELILGEMIVLARGVLVKSRDLHKGIWNKSSKGSFELRGKTLGIIGYGNIGSQLSVVAEALGMKVIFFDIEEKLPMGNSIQSRILSPLLKRSDIITVHVDGRERNNNLISEKEFGLMKNGAIFINASRGFIVDIKALARHLKNGHLRGAAVDVFPNEPKSSDETFVSLLQNIDNVILTPHIGGSTVEAQQNIAQFVSGKIIDYINVGNSSMSVNIPQIQLPKQQSVHRLLHLHRNVPGILASINGCLWENGINIVGQYLKTNESIGYVITDINKKYDQKVLDELRSIKDTIRFRVLY